MELAYLIFQVLIFPGLLFTAGVGLFLSWIDRKVTARIQMRVGPPLLQPFYDIIKFMLRETCIPQGAPRGLFLTAPLLGLAGVTLATLLLWRGILPLGQTFNGDLIVVLYLLTLPATAVILGAFASQNPLASLGGSREMKLLLAYELPLLLAILVPVLKVHSIRLIDLAGSVATFHSFSGFLALLTAIICMQAKLTLAPFDAPEAETELAGGAYLEYSGPPLGIFRLTRAMMLFTMPVFVAVVFCGISSDHGLTGGILAALKILGLIVISILIRNTVPRMRIDHVVKFFWGPVTLVALMALGAALMGR